MAITLLDPATSLTVGVLTKSTAYRIQFAVESDASGGPLNVSAAGLAGSTTLAALVGGQPLRAAALLALFETPTVGSPTAAVARTMQDVEVISCARGALAAAAVPSLGINWLGNVSSNLFPFLSLVAPATSAGGVWSVIIELRNSLIG